jgi:hypothetical protein
LALPLHLLSIAFFQAVFCESVMVPVTLILTVALTAHGLRPALSVNFESQLYVPLQPGAEAGVPLMVSETGWLTSRGGKVCVSQGLQGGVDDAGGGGGLPPQLHMHFLPLQTDEKLR